MRTEDLLKQTPLANRAMLVDMNSYFASVEQQVQPKLRGKPIAVCPYPTSSASCVIAASIEAKAYGIKTGHRVFQAKALCPELILVADHPNAYRHYHNEIIKLLHQTRCQVLVKSIDEALLVVPADLRESVPNLAQEIKEQIRRVGRELRCSIGISSNFFLAKMASNVLKPDGLITLPVDHVSLERFYNSLSLQDLYGISYRMTKRFLGMGITSPLALYRTDHAFLKQQLGINGEAWYLRLRGYETDLKPTHKQSVGHQTTIVPDATSDREELLAAISQLTTKVARRLLHYGLSARHLNLSLRLADRSWWGDSYIQNEPFYNANTLLRQAEKLLPNPLPGPVRLVSIVATHLIERSFVNLNLFEPTNKLEDLSEAIDQIERRYGRIIFTGRQLEATQVPDRIGFGRT